MPKVCSLLTAATFLLWASTAPGQTIIPIIKPPPEIVTTGEVDLTSLIIKRQKSGNAAKDPDASSLELQLYVGKFLSNELWRTHLRITELEPIEDDTGKLLSTEKRLAAIPALKNKVEVQSPKRTAETSGAIVQFAVAAPARTATKIKRLAGKAVLTHDRLRLVRFADQTAAELSGKPLEHPIIGEHKVVSTLEFKDNVTKLTVSVPAKGPRLHSFVLQKDNQDVANNLGFSSRNDGVCIEQSRSYRGDQTADTHLLLCFAEEDNA